MSKYSHEYYMAHRYDGYGHELPEVRKDPSIPYGQTVYKPKNPFDFTSEELWMIYLKYKTLIGEVMDMI